MKEDSKILWNSPTQAGRRSVKERRVPFSQPFRFSRRWLITQVALESLSSVLALDRVVRLPVSPFNFPFFCAFSSPRFFSFNKRHRQEKKSKPEIHYCVLLWPAAFFFEKKIFRCAWLHIGSFVRFWLREKTRRRKRKTSQVVSLIAKRFGHVD